MCPPNLAGLTLPVLHLRLMNLPTMLKANLYDSATCSRLCPNCQSACKICTPNNSPNSIAATAAARTVAAGCRRQGFGSRWPRR
jgi:hypothetical protein